MKQKLLSKAFSICHIDDIKTLYHESFPEEERRDWCDVVDMINQNHQYYNVNVITIDERFAGFILWWDFESFRYVEHFAIKEEMRGKGIGGRSIQNFVAMRPSSVVLEVELPSVGEMACRRIEFYKRHGFNAMTDIEYVQPPYSPNLPEVPMMLMLAANNNETIGIAEIAKQIHRYVYKKG